MSEKNRKLAQNLRKNATPEERHLWYDFLKDYPVQFRRQVPFGPYILDFYCHLARLAVELDGSQHYEAPVQQYDAERTAFLEREYGIQVLRFSNFDINRKFPAVCDVIDRAVGERRPSFERTIMKHVTIYTDGACSGNPGPGGWGAILKYGAREKELGGGEASTTNNRMELLGVISALQALKEPCEVDLYSDSQYICNAINQHWLDGWKKAGWKRKGGELKNPDLWKNLDELLQTHQVTFHWVKGHADNAYNNRCDQIAVREREKFA